jgi:hypothetical protein
MREIKFRWYCKKCKKMRYNDDCFIAFYNTNNDSGEYVDICIETDGCTHDKHKEVMQFTGLKDKNGKENYDLDFLKYKGEIYKVYWDESSFRFNLARFNNFSELSSLDNLCYFESIGIEVIGNIYDNKELLK